MPRTNNSLFVLHRSLLSYLNSQSTSMSLSLSSISELSGAHAASSTSDRGGGGGHLFKAGGWVLIIFFYLQGGRLFKVGTYSRLGT